MLQKMEEGFVFDKYGKFKLSIKLDTLFTKNLFNLFEQVAQELREKFSLNLFPTYGTMLGAVREGDFIGHDNDFDTTYVSKHSEPEAVRREFMQICAFLIERGYDLKVKKTHTRVRVPGTAHKFDIFFSYFNQSGFYELSYGTHGPALPRSDDFDVFVDQKLNELTIKVPKNNEAMLAQIYGTTWRIPNAGFKHKASTRHWDRRYHLTVPEVSSLYWKQFYRDNPIAGGSPFAMFIAEKLRRDSLVVELGCGSGRDSVYFAQHNHTVFASDRADEALDPRPQERRAADQHRLREGRCGGRRAGARLLHQGVRQPAGDRRQGAVHALLPALGHQGHPGRDPGRRARHAAAEDDGGAGVPHREGRRREARVRLALPPLHPDGGDDGDPRSQGLRGQPCGRVPRPLALPGRRPVPLPHPRRQVVGFASITSAAVRKASSAAGKPQ
ncbi:hypothetical protein HK414_10240 [Ramlibacter terrae]|uniref:Class I SAM-dependent methyltransferase n=1 Tax=Ramlibacter terrae TaxID=2732511 RepID=A0ABX6P432_9BURK|nr:hypothetical protein HK414_10240 [Ramlibacter terrae]